jgi:hypothetical protein
VLHRPVEPARISGNWDLGQKSHFAESCLL